MPSISLSRGGSPPSPMEQFNTFMSRLNRLLSTPTGIDKLLMTTTYTLQLLPPTASHPRLRALSSLISDVRIFLRLWGIVGIYAWLQDALRSRRPDPIVIAQIAANAAFQLLENAAYLAKHGVLGVSRRTQARLWIWSSRFWMGHVGLEFLRLFGGRGKREKGWERMVACNFAYLPLTLHWSVEGGAVPPETVAACGTIAAVIGLQNAWRRTES